MAQLDTASRCDHCFRKTYGRKCTRRECPGYFPTWCGDSQRVLKAALAAWEGESTMITITAGGHREHPWDRLWCSHSEGEACSGPAGCKVFAEPASEWNSTAQSRARKLVNAARQYAARRHGRGDLPEVLACVQQPQSRGLVHLHLAVGYQPHQRAALEDFYVGLRRNAKAHGFGPKLDLGKPGRFSDGSIGGYMGRYLSARRDDGESTLAMLKSVSARNRERAMCGEPRRIMRPLWVSPRLQRKARVSMGFERWNRRAWFQWGCTGTRAERQAYFALVQAFKPRGSPVDVVPAVASEDADAAEMPPLVYLQEVVDGPGVERRVGQRLTWAAIRYG